MTSTALPARSRTQSTASSGRSSAGPGSRAAVVLARCARRTAWSELVKEMLLTRDLGWSAAAHQQWVTGLL